MNKKNNVSKIMGALFLVGLLAASIAVSIHNFQMQTAFAVSATDNAATHDGNNITNTTQPASTHLMNSGNVPTDAETKLVLALRDLWVDHTDWTRMYIVSFLADLPDTDVVAQRLLKNQEDIGNAIKPFYGEDAGNKLTDLLNGHILVAVDLLKEAKAGDSSAAAVSEEEWYQNADEIASFLSGANPNWSKDDLRNMLNEHLVLTKAEAVARLTGNYTGDIATFDQIHKHANGMSDAIVAGIVKQFPERFSTTVSTPSTTTVPKKS
jgi:hypothetical protein